MDFLHSRYRTLCLLTKPFKWKAALSEQKILSLFLSSVNNGNSIWHILIRSWKSSSYNCWANCALYSFSNKYSVVIRYVVVCGIEETSAIDRTFDPGWVWVKSLISLTFSWLINYCRSSRLQHPWSHKIFHIWLWCHVQLVYFCQNHIAISFYNCDWFKFGHE